MRQSPPLPTTKCRRTKCSRAFADHVAGKCPDGRGEFKRSYGRVRQRSSTSLSPAEVLALDTVLRVLQRGGDTRVVAQQLARPLGLLANKMARMKARIAAAKHSACPDEADSSPNPSAAPHSSGRAEAVGGAT
jgi:hypothetical protein